MKKDEIIWDNIERITKEKGWSFVELAKKSKTRPQTLNNIKSGVRGIGSNLLNRFSDALNVDVEELLLSNIPIRNDKPIPVISWVRAGEFATAVDSWPVGVSGISDPVCSFVATSPNAFGLIIEGESMMPRFMPGDVVIVDPELRCDNGSACVVSVNSEVSLKLFYDRENEIILRPMNDKYPETIIKKDSRVEFVVIGKVVDIKPKI